MGDGNDANDELLGVYMMIMMVLCPKAGSLAFYATWG